MSFSSRLTKSRSAWVDFWLNAWFVVIVLVAVTLLLVYVVGRVTFNRPGATQAKAYEAVDRYLRRSNLVALRQTCAGDIDQDGYASCAVGLKEETIYLECPVGYFNVTYLGVTDCKETLGGFRMTGNVRPQ